MVPSITPHEPSLMTLRVPADASYGVVVRSVVAAVAALDDPSIDELDDIRLAAQEGFVSLVAAFKGASSLDVDIVRGDGELSLEFRILGKPGTADVDGLSMSVLKTLASHLESVDEATGRRLSVTLPLRGGR